MVKFIERLLCWCVVLTALYGWHKTRFINLASVWKDERVFINPIGKLTQSSFISTNIGFLKGSLLSNEGDIKAVMLLIEAIVGQFALLRRSSKLTYKSFD